MIQCHATGSRQRAGEWEEQDPDWIEQYMICNGVFVKVQAEKQQQTIRAMQMQGMR